MHTDLHRQYLPAFLTLCILHPDDARFRAALHLFQDAIQRRFPSLEERIAWVISRSVFAAITVDAATIIPALPLDLAEPEERPASFAHAEALLLRMIGQRSGLLNFPRAHGMHPSTDALERAAEFHIPGILTLAEAHARSEAPRDAAFWRRERFLQRILTGHST